MVVKFINFSRVSKKRNLSDKEKQEFIEQNQEKHYTMIEDNIAKKIFNSLLLNQDLIINDFIEKYKNLIKEIYEPNFILHLRYELNSLSISKPFKGRIGAMKDIEEKIIAFKNNEVNFPLRNEEQEINSTIKSFFETFFTKNLSSKISNRFLNKKPEKVQYDILKEFKEYQSSYNPYKSSHNNDEAFNKSFSGYYTTIDFNDTYSTQGNGGKKPDLDFFDNPYGVYS